jgi:hypothetical protein
VISGLIFGIGSARRLLVELWWNLWWVLRIPWLKLRNTLRECWYSKESRKVAREFLAELAVLIAVFPALDVLIANRQIPVDPKLGQTVQPISLAVVVGLSAFFVIGFLLAAFILASKEKGD